MEAGDLKMDCRVHHHGDVYFPVSHYHRITVGFFCDWAEKSVREAVSGVSVDLSALADKFCGKDGLWIESIFVIFVEFRLRHRKKFRCLFFVF